MTVVPVSHFLRDLTAEPGRRLARPFGDSSAEGRASDIEARIAEAHARGVLEGQAAAQAEYGEDLRRQAKDLEERFAAERRQWVSQQSAAMGRQLEAQLGSIADKISDQVGSVLKPFVMEIVRERAIADLRSALSQMLLKGEYARITITAPEDLAHDLKSELEGKVGDIQINASETVEVTVSVDETILETRVAAWAEAILGEG